MKKIILVNKKEGETPLEVLDRLRKKGKIYKDIKMTYAGRLDPMASGILLVLLGEETKKKEKYLILSKEYEFEILFGFSTDTHDLLGKVIKHGVRQDLTQKELKKQVKQNIKHFTGKFLQEYPHFSSKTVKGKPLFEYAKGKYGGLNSIKIPKKEVSVKEFKFFKLRKIDNERLLQNIEKRVSKVKGDFRQKEIIKIWHKYLNISTSTRQGLDKFFIGNFKIKCGSGTYVRGVVNSLGEKMGIPALAFSIKRIKVGKWSKVA